jgi:hypothetical protein
MTSKMYAVGKGNFFKEDDISRIMPSVKAVALILTTSKLTLFSL